MYKLSAVLLLLILLSTPASAGWVISEFCPDGFASGDGDEYFVLEGLGSLSEISVSDGEGTLTFPSSSSSGKIIVARSAEAYYSVHSSYPDFEITDSSTKIPNVIKNGKFQMANSDDELILSVGGAASQKVSWPEDVKSSNGRIHIYENGVWDKRVLKIGQSRFTPQTFTADSAVLFVSPDSSYKEVIGFMDDADYKLLISMYEFTSSDIALAVSNACRRGVSVKILMEGGPVGGISEEEKGVLNYLTKSGASVYTIESTSKLPARYRYLHAKYAVADDGAVLITSENFKESGIPKTDTRGNRGWGAVIYDREVADYFSKVFTSDISGYDIYEYELSGETLPDSWSDVSAGAIFDSKTVYNVNVTPVISPDTSYLVEDLIGSSKISLDIQQAYISKYPDSENEWIASAINTAKRGVNLRVMLDGMYYNTEDDADNDELIASLNRLGLENVFAKLMNPDESITKLHNKGVISDGRYVLISSINWNYNSPNNNREAGVIIESEEAAEYFTKVFNYDFSGVRTDFVSARIGIDFRLIIASVILTVFVSALIIRKIKK
ncbi:MAG: phospholipase D-like domain-containing protein [Methanocorpusculum sp.]|nr:phospholipase D-like domain-containing protein [Methanocorpusculum sp.]